MSGGFGGGLEVVEYFGLFLKCKGLSVTVEISCFRWQCGLRQRPPASKGHFTFLKYKVELSILGDWTLTCFQTQTDL